jgi:hypothetical protein
MANALYPLTKAKMLQAGIDMSTGTVKAVLVSTAYTYSAAHDFHNDLTGILATTAALTSKTFTSGTFDAADTTFGTVAAGSTGKAVVLYIDTGNTATSPLIAYLDSLTLLPVTTDGGEILVTWDAAGIFTL